MPIERLVAGGCVRRVVSWLVSARRFGLAPRFRAAVQAGEVEIDEVQRAHADLPPAGRGPSPAVRPDEGGARHRHDRPPPGDDPPRARPRHGRGLRRVHAAPPRRRRRPRLRGRQPRQRPRRPEARLDGRRGLPGRRDDDRDRRADRAGALLRRRALAHDLSALHGRRRRRGAGGAYPTSCFPLYGYDGDIFRSYVAAHADPEEARRLWSERIDGPESHGAFLDANGGAATLLGIAGSRSVSATAATIDELMVVTPLPRSSATTRVRSTAPSRSSRSAPTCSRGGRMHPTSSGPRARSRSTPTRPRSPSRPSRTASGAAPRCCPARPTTSGRSRRVGRYNTFAFRGAQMDAAATSTTP